MVKRIFIFLLTLTVFCSAYAQQDTLSVTPMREHVRISIITVGPGEYVWEALGHICIRVIDSNKTGKARDIVYNYGTFDNYEQEFEKKMIEGTLLYYLSVMPYDFFINNYVEKNRSVEEQVFLLDAAQATTFLKNLENNALPKNKYYQYNFFVDNCSTRIYYMIAQTFGNSFVFGHALPKVRISYFDLCYEYYRYRYWERIGVNIFFEDRMNRTVTNEEAMFLPAYLSRGLEGATLNGKKLCEDKIILARENLPPLPSTDVPLILTCFIALLTIGGFSYQRLSILGKIMSYLVMFISGAIGCLILYAWFGTSHTGCENNFNLLWALPTNIVIPFLGPKIKVKYAIAAISLIGLSLIFYILRLQTMPLLELTPLLLAQLWVFGIMYRSNVKKLAQ